MGRMRKLPLGMREAAEDVVAEGGDGEERHDGDHRNDDAVLDDGRPPLSPGERLQRKEEMQYHRSTVSKEPGVANQRFSSHWISAFS